MNEWKVTSVYVGETAYAVYRKLRPEEPLSARNVVTDGVVYGSEKEAAERAESLNREEADRAAVAKAVRALGFPKGNTRIRMTPIPGFGRAMVHLNGKYLGVFDFKRDTFVD